MIELSKRNIETVSRDTGFIKDCVEKVMRLIDILEVIFTSEYKDKLVLKGGTAINLFFANMPRLSVDIDLDYIGKTKEEMLQERESISNYLKSVLYPKGYVFLESSKNHFALDSLVFQFKNAEGNRDNIKVEINYLDRTHILKTRSYKIRQLGYEGDVDISVLDKYELYGSKLAALLGRSKPRDIYDVSKAINSGIFTDYDLLRKCFIFYNCISGKANILEKNFSIIDGVGFREFRRMLQPVLSRNERFDWEETKENVKKYLEDLLVFTKNEEEFVNNFINKKYCPELLFDEEKYQESAARILWHPMAYWRCKSVDNTSNNNEELGNTIKDSISTEVENSTK